MNEDEQLIKNEAAMGAQNLYYFCKYILGYQEIEEKPHRDLCQFLQTKEKDRPGKLILMPRGSFKSSIATIGTTVQDVVNNPNIRILIASETYQNAQKFLREIKGHFETNQEFINHYGNLVSPVGWTETEITVNKRTKNLKEPTISTAGIDVTKVGMHYDKIVVDDPVSQNNITSPEQIQKTLEWFQQLFSLLEPGGEVVVIGTRWDDLDLYGYIIDMAEKLRFNIYVRSAIDKEGNLLFPTRLTHEFLDNTLAIQGSYIFACQYLNDPVPMENAVLGNVMKYYPENIMGKKLYKFAAMDLAISQKQTADYNAWVVVGVDEDKNWYVLDAIHKRCTPKEAIDFTFALYSLHKPVKIGVETVAFQKAMIYMFQEEMANRKQFLPLEELKSDTDKLRRILSIQPKVQNAQLFIKDDQADLEYEMRRFPRGKHDDLVDALAYINQIVYYPQKERRAIEYEPENETTGY